MDLKKKNLITGEPSIKRTSGKSSGKSSGAGKSGGASSAASGKRARAESAGEESGLTKRIMIEIKRDPDPVFTYPAIAAKDVTQVSSK